MQGIGKEEVTRQCRTNRPETFSGAMELARVWANPPCRAPGRTLTVPPSAVGPSSGPAKALTIAGATRGLPSLPAPRNPPIQTPNYRKRPPRCGLCGMDGHWSRDCPNLSNEQQLLFRKKYRENLQSRAAGSSSPGRSGPSSAGGQASATPATSKSEQSPASNPSQGN